MTALDVLDTLLELGVAVTVDGGGLHLYGPKGAVSAELLAEVRAHKAVLVALLGPPDQAAPQRHEDAKVPPSGCPRPAWAEGQIGIEELRDFLEAHGLRVLDVTWPEGAKRPFAVLAPGDGED